MVANDDVAGGSRWLLWLRRKSNSERWGKGGGGRGWCICVDADANADADAEWQRSASGLTLTTMQGRGTLLYIYIGVDTVAERCRRRCRALASASSSSSSPLAPYLAVTLPPHPQQLLTAPNSAAIRHHKKRNRDIEIIFFPIVFVLPSIKLTVLR